MHLASLMNPGMGTSLAEMAYVANRVTYSRAKAEAMGFTFGPVVIAEDAMLGGVRVRIDFHCVCGRHEVFQTTLSPLMHVSELTHRLDLVAELWRLGSFSRDHLIADGYTSDQIDDFERKAEEFDKSCRRELYPLHPSDEDLRYAAFRRSGR